MQLSDYIGQQLMLFVRPLGNKLQEVTLLGVEAGGVWLECQNVTNAALASLSAPSSQNTPVWFVPYGEITLGFAAIPKRALNEKAFGL
jgi:hypothetical protein